jgi:hypothetical protein
MKKKSPAFQFYAAEFLADENVVLMTNRELGCYIKLICYCWREGSIPSDVPKIAKLCGEDGLAMAELWLAISSCFEMIDGDTSRLVHPRLESERKKQIGYRKGRSEAGSKGAKARWGNDLGENSSAIAKPCQKNGSAIDLPMAKNSSSSSSSNNKDIAPSSLKLLLDMNIPEGLAKDWIKIRKEKKQPLTETALKATIREAAKVGYSLERAITVACENSWAGFKASWITPDAQTRGLVL